MVIQAPLMLQNRLPKPCSVELLTASGSACRCAHYHQSSSQDTLVTCVAAKLLPALPALRKRALRSCLGPVSCRLQLAPETTAALHTVDYPSVVALRVQVLGYQDSGDVTVPSQRTQEAPEAEDGTRCHLPGSVQLV